MTTIKAFFDKDVFTNPFIGAGGNGVGVDDFNADNFDHAKEGFVGGSPFWVNRRAPSRSPACRPLRAPRPGAASGKRRWRMPTPTTFRWTPTARTSRTATTIWISIPTTRTSLASRCCADVRLAGKRHQDGAVHVRQDGADRQGDEPETDRRQPENANSHFDTTSYQTTHMNGGAVMGKIRRPARSTAICRAGTCTTCSRSAPRPSRRGWAGPTGTVAALAYWSARAIREQYLKTQAHWCRHKDGER